MARARKTPDTHTVLIDNIESLCKMQGVSLEEQRIILRLSSATYCSRRAKPENFKLGELEKLAKRLNVTVVQLLTERKFVGV